MNNKKILQISLFCISLMVMAHAVGLALASAILLMIYFHEIGHITAAKRFGCKTHGIFMLPFIGGIATISGDLSRYENAIVALWGPLYGMLFSIILMAASFVFPMFSPILLKSALYCSFINLFNLLPMNPLDGGQILKCLAFSWHAKIGKITMILGVIASIWLAAHFGSAIMIALAFLSLVDLKFENDRSSMPSCMSALNATKIISLAFLVTGLLFLVFGFSGHLLDLGH